MSARSLSVGNASVYLALDDAREKLRERWADEALRREVELFLNGNLSDGFGVEPRSLLPRNLASPDNGLMWFLSCSAYLGVSPLAGEYMADRYSRRNEEKAGLVKLRVLREDGRKQFVRIASNNASDGRLIAEVKTTSGESLVDFHHRLLRRHANIVALDVRDYSHWLNSYGKACDYYLPHLARFIAHGVLFENFMTDEGCKEFSFTHEIVFPAIEALRKRFGVLPMVVRLYPENQSEEEDWYWWSYPKAINDRIVAYARENRLTFF